MAPSLAWLRYSGPLTDWEIEQAAGRFRAVILQPWEEEGARRLKERDPRITVLAYQCLSSVREYELGPRFTSGVPPRVASAENTYARDERGPIEWARYPGHFQQKVWEPHYRRLWVDHVTEWMKKSPFDGVMADNDVFDDYYSHGLDPEMLRASLDTLVDEAGAALESVDKLLVPNIAEARRQPGRWERHSRFGGGLEECFLGWGTAEDEWLDVAACLAQVPQLTASGLTIARVPGTGEPEDPSLALAIATAWVFAPESDVAVTATAHDGYGVMPVVDTPDLGTSLGAWAQSGTHVFHRTFTGGTAAVNLGPSEAAFDGALLPPKTGLLKVT